MIYSSEKQVPASQCDGRAKLSVLGAFQIVQDALTEMMKKLKIDGVTAVKKYGAMWVFSKNKIKFARDVAWNETIVVESFLSSRSLAKITIDTAIKNSKGKLIAYSKTEACALDVTTKKIRKVDSVGVTSKTKIHDALFDLRFEKFLPQVPSKVESVRVGSTCIDYCHHCNNVEYVRFVLNCIPTSKLEAQPPRMIEIAFVNQSFENDELEIWQSVDKTSLIFEIKKEGNTIVECRVE